MMHRKLLKWTKIIALSVIILLIVFIVLLIITKPVSTTYYITANTEKIIYTTQDQNVSRIVLKNAEIGYEDSIIYKNFNGSLELNDSVKVEIERISNGPAYIYIERKNEKVGTLYKEENNKKTLIAYDLIDIVFTDIEQLSSLGENITIPITGNIDIGRSIDFETSGGSTAVLRNGEVLLTKSSIVGHKHYIANRYDLLLGDKVVLNENLSFGFALINEEPGMKISIRTLSDEAKIVKPGPKDTDTSIILAANWLDRLTKDEFCRSISFILGGILILTTFITFLFDFRNFKK